MSSPVETFTVRAGAAARFSVHCFRGELFAETSDTHEAFGFSTMSGFRGELSRQEITCVENNELKQALQRTGLVRFIDDAGLTKLIETRLEGAAKHFALESLDRARRGGMAAAEVEAPPPLPPNAPVPVMVVTADRFPANVPVPALPDPTVPRFQLPRGEGCWDDEKFVVGKKVSVSSSQ